MCIRRHPVPISCSLLLWPDHLMDFCCSAAWTTIYPQSYNSNDSQRELTTEASEFHLYFQIHFLPCRLLQKADLDRLCPLDTLALWFPVGSVGQSHWQGIIGGERRDGGYNFSQGGVACLPRCSSHQSFGHTSYRSLFIRYQLPSAANPWLLHWPWPSWNLPPALWVVLWLNLLCY